MRRIEGSKDVSDNWILLHRSSPITLGWIFQHNRLEIQKKKRDLTSYTIITVGQIRRKWTLKPIVFITISLFYSSYLHDVRLWQEIKKKNSVALVRERTIPTERSPTVGEVSANFLRIDGCHVASATYPHGRLSLFSGPEPLLFYSSSSSIDLTRLSGPRSRPTTTQKIW